MDASDPMNADAMLDYTLGQLDETQREAFEQAVAADPVLAEKVDRLARHLHLLVDDGEGPEPPADLARRTLRRVAERKRRPAYSDLVPVKVPFRWADVAVAASLFIACLLTLVPALKRSRETWNTAACTNNLHQLGLALNRYAETHKTFPTIPAGDAVPFAGTFALRLREAGLLPDPSVLDCPCDGVNNIPSTFPDLRTLAKLGPNRASEMPVLNHADYAYTLGFEEGGRPTAVPAHVHNDFPLLADRPPYADSVEILEGNSPNHHGAGQNVLFVGGHVGFYPTRQLGQDRDMFLNDRHLPAPGVHSRDAVLVPGITRVRSR
jgi:hypothetical protein